MAITNRTEVKADRDGPYILVSGRRYRPQGGPEATGAQVPTALLDGGMVDYQIAHGALSVPLILWVTPVQPFEVLGREDWTLDMRDM